MRRNIKIKSKVRQLEHLNQFTIENDNGIYFQSYDSIIAHIDKNNNIFLDKEYWDYSKTTMKHLCLFLDIVWSKKNIQSKIDNDEYFLINLNK